MKSKTDAASKDSSRFQGCLMYGFFAAFALAGLITAYFLLISPVYNLVSAQSWQPVSCTITSSTVESSNSSDGDTYRIAITYSYDFQGLSYVGDRYNFSLGSSSGYKGKAEVVEAHPPGLETLCFVDPDAPESSVINRSPGLYLLWGLFPIPFLLVGFGGLIGIYFGRRITSGKSDIATWAPTQESALLRHDVSDSTEPLVLESESSPMGRAIAFGIFALIWNGIAATITYMIYQDEGFGFPMIFMAFFLLAGIFLIGLTIHQVLACANPKPRLVLTPSQPILGEPCKLDWSLVGRKAGVDHILIQIEARESATYRRGTDTVTDHSTFHRETLFDGRPTVLRQGSSHFILPERSMPSFEADNNKIEWRIAIHGNIPRWPDIKEEFPLTVLPPTRNTAGGAR